MQLCSQIILPDLKALYLIERQRDRDLPPASFSPNPTTARAGSGQNQESGAQSGSPTWAAGTQVLEPPPAAPQVCISRNLELAVEGWNSNPKLVYGVQVSQATSQPLGLMPTCVYEILKRKEKEPHLTISLVLCLAPCHLCALCLNGSNAGGAAALKGSPLHE